jgi:hypothetical protein
LRLPFETFYLFDLKVEPISPSFDNHDSAKKPVGVSDTSSVDAPKDERTEYGDDQASPKKQEESFERVVDAFREKRNV